MATLERCPTHLDWTPLEYDVEIRHLQGDDYSVEVTLDRFSARVRVQRHDFNAPVRVQRHDGPNTHGLVQELAALARAVSYEMNLVF